MRSIKKNDNKILIDGLYVGVLLLLVAFYLWRIKYGYVGTDEQFMLATPYRLLTGDRLIIDEWNPSQLWNVLLVPIMYIYKQFGASFDGVYLHFRLLFAVSHLAISSFLYLTLRRISKPIALICFSIMAIYVPFGIFSFGYNSCGMWAVLLLFCISNYLEMHDSANDESQIPGRIVDIVTGMLIASLVLCNPACIILYLLQLVYWIFRCRKHGKKVFSGVVFIHLGIAIPGILFITLVYKGGPIIDFLQVFRSNVRYMLSDQSHGVKSITGMLSPIIDFATEFYAFTILYAVLLIAGTLRKEKRYIYMLGLTASTLSELAFFIIKADWFSTMHYFLPLLPLGLAAYLWTDVKKRTLFYCGYVPSIGYAFALMCTSNNGILIFAHGSVLASVLSIALFYCWICEQSVGKKYRMALLPLFLVGVITQFAFQMWNRINENFWEEDTFSLDSEIEIGPFKGIYTTEDKKTLYEEQTAEIRAIPANSKDSIIFFRQRYDGYFLTNARFGGYSSYLYEEKNLESDRMRDYFSSHPDRVPEFIYVDTQSINDESLVYLNDYCSRNGYELKGLESGSYLLTRFEL